MSLPGTGEANTHWLVRRNKSFDFENALHENFNMNKKYYQNRKMFYCPVELSGLKHLSHFAHLSLKTTKETFHLKIKQNLV